MALELTPQQLEALQLQPQQRLELIDPATRRGYVLISQEEYQRVAPLLPQAANGTAEETVSDEIPPMIRRSQEALRRDLPELLSQKKLFMQWVCYHGEERIGIARDPTKLIRECLQRGLGEADYYIGLISPEERVEVEELEYRPHMAAEKPESQPTT